MRRRLLLVGSSPLIHLIARQLDSDLARRAELEVIMINRRERIVYAPLIKSLLGKKKYFKPKPYDYLKVTHKEVSSISLPRRQVITTSGTFDYDHLVLDQTPTFTPEEVDRLSEEVKKLVMQLSSRVHLGQRRRATVKFAGEASISWQLSLAVASDIKALPAAVAGLLSVQTDAAPSSQLVSFLRLAGVGKLQQETVSTTVEIRPPKRIVEPKHIKGATVGAQGYPHLNQFLNFEGYFDAIVVDHPLRRFHNTIGVDLTLAKSIVRNIEAAVDLTRQHPISMPQRALLLSSDQSHFYLGNRRASSGLLARTTAVLDRKRLGRFFL